MATEPAEIMGAGPLVRILEEKVDYSFLNLFKIVRAELQFRCFDGKMSEPVSRINFERGESVGVLLYDPKADAVVLVRQFRYPVYASLDPEERKGDGAWKAWVLEVVAGIIDGEHTAVQTANHELLEEAGYEVDGEWNYIAAFYPSPGGTSERIHLYWAEIDRRRKSGEGGGLIEEGENVQVVELPLSRAMEMLRNGEIRDAKTIIALQHLATAER